MPDTVYRINKHYTKNEQRMPLILVKLYTYQMLRALGYIHSMGVCHRYWVGGGWHREFREQCCFIEGLVQSPAGCTGNSSVIDCHRRHTQPSPFNVSLTSLTRDIKPQNLLVNVSTHALKLCDFGSAKTLVRGEPNISYICSRYYRAPELIFGATDYTCAIDVRIGDAHRGGEGDC